MYVYVYDVKREADWSINLLIMLFCIDNWMQPFLVSLKNSEIKLRFHHRTYRYYLLT